MIKVTCKDSTEPVKSEYPCLKVSRYYKRIVLFTAPKTGYELEGGKFTTRFHHSECWEEGDFQPYTGTIELSNEL